MKIIALLSIKNWSIKLMLCFLFLSSTIASFGQNKRVAIQFANTSVDCNRKELTVDIQGRSLEQGAVKTASWSFRFTRNENMLTNPRVLQNSNTLPLTGGGIQYSVREQPFLGDIITSVGILAFDHANTLETNSWVTLATVKFDIIRFDDNNPNCIDLVFKEGTDFPPTAGQEYVSFFSQPSLDLVSYGNDFTCIKKACLRTKPKNPIELSEGN